MSNFDKKKKKLSKVATARCIQRKRIAKGKLEKMYRRSLTVMPRVRFFKMQTCHRDFFRETFFDFSCENEKNKTDGNIRNTQKEGARRCILGRSTCRPQIYCLYGKFTANNFL